MRCKYANRDLAQRLDQSICRYKEKPVYVRVDGDRLVLYRPADLDNRLAVIKPTDEEFDISTPPLGYVQHNKRVYYLARRPLRKFKQGVDARSLNFSTLGEDNKGNIRLPNSPEDILYSEAFERSVMGLFPSLKDAINLLTSGTYTEVAISRDVAMSITKTGIIFVYYKNEEVGWMAPGSNTVKVPNSSKGWVVSKLLKGFSWEID